MRFIRNVWVRVIVSIIAGAMIQETIHEVYYPSVTKPADMSNFTFLFALILFMILSGLNKVLNKEEKKKLSEFEQWKNGASSEQK
jgi:uncharacterized membrane protein